MEWIALVAIALLAVALVVRWAALNLKPSSLSPSAYPYCRNDAFFTAAERSFLGVLDQVIGDQYRVMGKVRVADLVSVEPMKDRGRWQSAFNRISAKHFDFVLCDKDTVSPIAVIELDDKSHNATHRRQRDEFISGVCEAACLPLIRVPARRAYTRSDVQRLVVNGLNLKPQDVEAMEKVMNNVATVSSLSSDAKHQPLGDATANAPTCPKCSSSMFLREVQQGAYAGDKLWGCNQYPKCRGVVVVPGTSVDQAGESLEVVDKPIMSSGR